MWLHPVSLRPFIIFFSPTPLFFLQGVLRQRKSVFLPALFFHQLVYLCSMPYPQAREHTIVHCPRLIKHVAQSVALIDISGGSDGGWGVEPPSNLLCLYLLVFGVRVLFDQPGLLSMLCIFH